MLRARASEVVGPSVVKGKLAVRPFLRHDPSCTLRALSSLCLRLLPREVDKVLTMELASGAFGPALFARRRPGKNLNYRKTRQEARHFMNDRFPEFF